MFQRILDFINEEDLRRCAIATIEYNLVFLELRCFSSMFPSMPKGEIVSMNANDNTLGEYPKY